MNVNWFLNPDNVCCADAADFAAEFEKELGIGGLKEGIARFAEKPQRDGLILDSADRKNHVKFFVPDLHFEKWNRERKSGHIWVKNINAIVCRIRKPACNTENVLSGRFSVKTASCGGLMKLLF